MNQAMRFAIAGTMSAIVITTVLDATGYSMFSALPLLLLTGLFWYLQKMSRKEIGLIRGSLQAYTLALAFPLIVLGLTALIAWMNGAVDTSETDWEKTMLNIGLMSIIGIIAVLITEEGFFRGWLWGALKRAGKTDTQILIWTSLAFTLWHVSAISLDTGFDVPANEIPIYLLNATLIGAVFGILRLLSNSVVVPSVCHAVWNGLDYPLYGFGEKAGALGIEQTHIYGPEVGIVGLLLNSMFIVGLWFWVTKSGKNAKLVDKNSVDKE